MRVKGVDENSRRLRPALLEEARSPQGIFFFLSLAIRGFLRRPVDGPQAGRVHGKPKHHHANEVIQGFVAVPIERPGPASHSSSLYVCHEWSKRPGCSPVLEEANEEAPSLSPLAGCPWRNHHDGGRQQQHACTMEM